MAVSEMFPSVLSQLQADKALHHLPIWTHHHSWLQEITLREVTPILNVNMSTSNIGEKVRFLLEMSRLENAHVTVYTNLECFTLEDGADRSSRNVGTNSYYTLTLCVPYIILKCVNDQ